MQPRTNDRIQQGVEAIGGDPKAWARDITERVFDVYEGLVGSSAGRYSVRDEVTLADVMLAPAVENAMMLGIDPTRWKTLCRVWKDVDQLEAFRKGHWRRQEDTPENFRIEDA